MFAALSIADYPVYVSGLQIGIGNERNAGRIVAYQIERSHLRWSSKPFHYWLTIPGHDSCNLANAVFNRHGNLKPHLCGNFGEETNQGASAHADPGAVPQPDTISMIRNKSKARLFQ